MNAHDPDRSRDPFAPPPSGAPGAPAGSGVPAAPQPYPSPPQGSADPYGRVDESRSAGSRSSPYEPAGQYGRSGPGQGSYGSPSGQYGPEQGQYGQGAASSGSPPAPGYGQPPQPDGYGPPQSYGQHPQPYGYGPPQGYGQPPQPYGYGPPQGYGQPGPGGTADGPLGEQRGTGISILWFFLTFGIYSYFYNYRVHSEMQRHSGRGVGGGVALLLTFLAGIAMPFVTPSEVGSLYGRKGHQPPVSGWTGLWYVLPAVGAYLVTIIAVIAAAASSSTVDPVTGEATISDGAGVAIGVAVFVGLVVALAGGVVWFVKTNGALNRYWQSQGGSATGSW